MGTETERHMQFHSDLNDQLMVRHFVGSEQLGECFEYTVTLYSTSDDLKLESILGTSATVEVRMGFPEPRFFNGIVCEFSHLGREETYALYRVVLRPWFWLLTQARGCEVFQKLSVLDIARDMFGKGEGDKPATQQRASKRSELALFDDARLFPKPKQRDYTVQYHESDFDFLNRLFQEEGIYYYFRHELGKHTLVLADAIACHDTPQGCASIEYRRLGNEKQREIGQFFEWNATKQVRSGAVTLNDFDFKKSRGELDAQKSNPRAHKHADAEIYEYPGRYEERDPGQRFAQVRLEESLTAHELTRGVTDSTRLFAGALFALNHHPRKDQNREYLVIASRYDIDSGSYQSGGGGSVYMTTHVTALPSDVQYRPARTTHVPFVSGPQTARVVGPKDQEIWTDEFARVKLQFAWDRDGKFDENSSCWVRVAQAWAGAGFGSIHIPRVGQEVMVDFIDGDLDRPIVTGRVYNDYNKPPYALPSHATQSGIKSHTVQGTRDNFNELRFEDLKGKEEVFLQAERNLTTRVKSDSSTTVGHTHTHNVKKDINVSVQDGEYTVEVKKGRMFTEVPEAEFQVNSKFITGNATEDVELIVGPCKIRIDKTSIVLTAHDNTITLDASGIAIKGTQIRLN
ncbi:MAG TPA: type VI secretion system tip protein TssI/VgrG [Polyangiales bacterium]|nr:type VI secretion system tip protein TssI/VgrG [Polyangiales bacterium]